MHPIHCNLREKVAVFAEKFIAPRTDLPFTESFPYDIWKKLGEEQLLGIGIDAAYGGLGMGYGAISEAGYLMVRFGHNLGVVLSLMLQNLATKFLVSGFGSDFQKEEFLPGMAAGVTTVSFAVSEPGAGAHPKLLRTNARTVGEGYVLSGSKTYLTNGPIADLYIVIAETKIENGRKRYSAFLVPRNTSGLTVTKAMTLEALHPSPHGGISLSDCFVASSSLLGNPHSAYEDMVLPFRGVEDVMMMGSISGGVHCQLAAVIRLMRGMAMIPEEQKQLSARMDALVRLVHQIASDSAKTFDLENQKEDMSASIIGFRAVLSQIQSIFGQLVQGLDMGNETGINAMTRDLLFSGKIAAGAAKTREIRYGEDILQRKNAHEQPA